MKQITEFWLNCFGHSKVAFFCKVLLTLHASKVCSPKDLQFLTKVHSLLKQCFARASLDTILGYFIMIFKLILATINLDTPIQRNRITSPTRSNKKKINLSIEQIGYQFEHQHFFCISFLYGTFITGKFKSIPFTKIRQKHLLMNRLQLNGFPLKGRQEGTAMRMHRKTMQYTCHSMTFVNILSGL